jgi:hypothetical protein
MTPTAVASTPVRGCFIRGQVTWGKPLRQSEAIKNIPAVLSFELGTAGQLGYLFPCANRLEGQIVSAEFFVANQLETSPYLGTFALAMEPADTSASADEPQDVSSTRIPRDHAPSSKRSLNWTADEVNVIFVLFFSIFRSNIDEYDS